MKQIKLTKDKYALVDARYYEKLIQFSWHYRNRYASAYVNGNHIDMHRLIAAWEWGPNTNQIDHRNHNGLDNRVDNLRYASPTDNQMNRGPTANNTSGYKGVCWRKDRCKWEVKLRYQRKCYYLGYFISKLEAALAYNKKALELAGEFAWLNPV